jgi:hypothetical protein
MGCALWRQAGSGPAATYLFLLRQKKVSQKKATASLAPSGCPIVQYKKWEMAETRCAQTAAISNPFSVPHNRRGSKRMKIKDNINNNDNQILKCGKELTPQNWLAWFGCWGCF